MPENNSNTTSAHSITNESSQFTYDYFPMACGWASVEDLSIQFDGTNHFWGSKKGIININCKKIILREEKK